MSSGLEMWMEVGVDHGTRGWWGSGISKLESLHSRSSCIVATVDLYPGVSLKEYRPMITKQFGFGLQIVVAMRV